VSVMQGINPRLPTCCYLCPTPFRSLPNAMCSWPFGGGGGRPRIALSCACAGWAVGSRSALWWSKGWAPSGRTRWRREVWRPLRPFWRPFGLRFTYVTSVLVRHIETQRPRPGLGELLLLHVLEKRCVPTTSRR
jgi:hypothetical protein